MLDKIEILGYRRFVSAEVYVGRKTVAFVGPNESGKSSILSALRLFETDDALPPSDASRSQRGVAQGRDRAVVRIRLTLDDNQSRLASTLPIEPGSLRHIVFTKTASGGRSFSLVPTPVLSASVSDGLRRCWPAVRQALEVAFADLPDEEESPFDETDLEAISDFVSGKPKLPDAEVWEAVEAGIQQHLEADRSLAEKVSAFRTYFEWARPGVRLTQLVYDKIGGRLPQFVQFTDSLRSIRAEYALADKSIDDDPALGNLLRLAGLPLDQIRSALDEPDYLRQIEDNANQRLAEFFEARWKQERITVGLKVTESFLRVDVKDLADGAPGWIRITERSDGLRTFVALAAFLESGNFDQPPILLIDEAEQHLHQNAQGDLIRMLQDLTAVDQVIYTTHSPACLPSDLGNGVRFVEPISHGNSVIRHDFWSLDRNEHVGFNPLLMVMGAGAAAFSTLRSALVAEGVSDMLLLPTLIKLATGSAELPYQVSPGIATASRADMAKLDFVASRVVYLVDGDAGGGRGTLNWRRLAYPRRGFAPCRKALASRICSIATST